MIELRNVSKLFGGSENPAVRNVDLCIARGTMVVILGESGSGKTTTLKLINKLIEPSAGQILLNGVDIMGTDSIALRRRIGYVFQGIGLFPHMNVADNVAIVPRLLGWREKDVQQRLEELLELVGLPYAEYAMRVPQALSGGQQQRIGVARALAARPELLLMDEPFAALDPITRARLQRELLALKQMLDLTVVLVTHDVTEALLLADVVVVMKDGQIHATATPQDLIAEAQPDYVRELIATPLEQARQVASMSR